MTGQHRRLVQDQAVRVPWPVLLVALVMGLLTVLAGPSWGLTGGVLAAAAIVVRARWSRITAIRFKTKPRSPA